MTEKLFLRALAAARADARTRGHRPTGERLDHVVATAVAPEGGWRSRTLATRKSYLDAIEEHLKRRKIKYHRARTLLVSMATQKQLDEIGELVHHALRKKSIGHVAWQVIHPEGLHEYFLVGSDLYRASHVHLIDPETGLRSNAQKLASGIASSLKTIEEHGLEVDLDVKKKLKRRSS